MALGFDPNSLKRIRGTGGGDISISVDCGDKHFALSSLYVRFTSGSGTANLTVSLDAFENGLSNLPLYTFSSAGNGANVSLRIQDDELRQWFFMAVPEHSMSDKLLIEWTDPGTSTWEYYIDLYEYVPKEMTDASN